MAGNSFVNCFHRVCNANVFIGGCVFILVTAFPIAEITLGALAINECPAAPAVPVYVMVCGIVALLLLAMHVFPVILCPTAQCTVFWTLAYLSVGLFTFVWFIFGSYHIYSVYPPNYTKITIDPNSSNNSIPTPTSPSNKTGLTSENLNLSLPNLNHTRMINNNNKNQTLMNLIQTLASGNSSSNETHLIQTLASGNISTSETNLIGTLAHENSSSSETTVTESLASGNISSSETTVTESSASGNSISSETTVTETSASGNSISSETTVTEPYASGNSISSETTATETLASGKISSETNREHLNAPQTRRVAAAAPYCQKTVYLFAFWTTTLCYVFAAHGLVITVCIRGYMILADIISKYTF